MKIPLSVLTMLCALWLSQANRCGRIAASAAGHAPAYTLPVPTSRWAATSPDCWTTRASTIPELAATRYEADAAQQRSESAGALPDPVLRTELMDITKQGTTSPQLLPSQTGSTRYTLMQSVPWYRQARPAARGCRMHKRAQANGQVAASWSDLATRIKQTYAMHYFASASEQLAQQTLGAAGPSGTDRPDALCQRPRPAAGRDPRAGREDHVAQRTDRAAKTKAHHTHARLNACCRVR